MALSVLPEGLAASSTAIGAIAAQLAAAHAAAAPLITAVVPPAIDPVSQATVASFNASGVQHQSAATIGAEELGRAGDGLGETAASYASGDALGAALFAGGSVAP